MAGFDSINTNIWWYHGAPGGFPVLGRPNVAQSLTALQALKEREEVYSRGWGVTARNPHNAAIFEDEEFIIERRRLLRQGILLKRGPRY